MTFQLNLTATSATGTETKWTEPVSKGVRKVEFSPGDYKIDASLQNRVGLEPNDDGYLAEQSKTREIAEYLLLQAERGVSPADAVPPITVARFEGEKYLIGGHGRLSGLTVAQRGAANGMLSDLFGEDESADVDADAVTETLKSIRVHTYECETRRDLETLAGLENSKSQNGERLTNKELVAIIEAGLRDPMKAQYKDAAFSIKFLGVSSSETTTMRNKVNNIRRRMYKNGETPLAQGVINIHGEPMKPTRPGSTTLADLNVVVKQLDTEYDHLCDPEHEARKGKRPYRGFESVVGKYEKQREAANTWLSDEEQDSLDEWIEELKVRIGYVDFMNENAEGKAAESAEVKTSTEIAAEQTKDEDATADTVAMAQALLSNTPAAETVTEPTTAETVTEPVETVTEPTTAETVTEPVENEADYTRLQSLGALLNEAKTLRDQLVIDGVADTKPLMEQVVSLIADAIRTEEAEVEA